MPGSIGYLIVKSLHISSVVFWMAGMLYLPRLFVYHHIAKYNGEMEATLKVQEKRLLKIIMNPALVLTWFFAFIMLIVNSSLLYQGWFHLKLFFVIVLSGLHGFYSQSVRKFQTGERPKNEKFWRLLNEVPAIGVILIIFLAVVKPF